MTWHAEKSAPQFGKGTCVLVVDIDIAYEMSITETLRSKWQTLPRKYQFQNGRNKLAVVFLIFLLKNQTEKVFNRIKLV